MTDITDKVAKLLNQAENTDNEAEAAVFLAKAQTLATIHSIDQARARHATRAKEKTTPVVRKIILGVRGTRGLNTLVKLISGIAAANNLKITIAANSSYIIAYGFAEDIDVTEALYASLAVQMATAVADWKAKGSWKTTVIHRPGRWRKVRDGDEGPDYEYIPGGEVPIPWLTARLDFQEAFARRVGVRLFLTKHEAERRAAAEETVVSSDAGSGTELVLAEKAKTVSDFYEANHNARGF